MKNLLPSLSLVGLVVLSWFVYLQSADIKNMQARLVQLNAESSEKAKTNSLDLQQKCATQAHTQFVQSGWDNEKMAGFISHYNEKMNSCYMVISNTDTRTAAPNITTSYTLVDAFEGKVFGNYMWQSRKGKTYAEVAPFMCDVILPSGEKKACESAEEFKQLIGAYMGDMTNQ